MRIKFLRDWRAYRTGQIVDPIAVGLGRGPVVELVNRGIVAYVGSETAPGYQTMTMQPVQTMVKRKGKNQAKGL